MAGHSQEVEDIAAVAGDSKNGNFRAPRFDRHYRGWTAPLLRSSQEGDDILFFRIQYRPQLRVQRTNWSTAPKLILLKPDLDVSLAENREKHSRIHHSRGLNRHR